jgi:hypothetical protein
MTRRRLPPVACALVLSAAAAMFAAALPATTKAEVVTLAGGREGGLWSRIGLGLAQAVKVGAPDITLAYVASRDGVTNAKLLSQGGIDLALVQAAELAAARQGIAPFGEALQGLTAVAGLDLSAPVHVLVRRETAETLTGQLGRPPRARDLARLPAPRIGLMPDDGISAAIARSVLSAAGMADGAAPDAPTVVHGGLRRQLSALTAGELDAVVAPILLGHTAVAEAAEAAGLALLPLGEETRDALGDRFGMTAQSIPAGAYGFVEAPVDSAASQLVLAARAESDPVRIERVTRALFENLDRLRAVHPLLGGLEAERMAAVRAAPLHPGAEAYLTAKGLLDER